VQFVKLQCFPQIEDLLHENAGDVGEDVVAAVRGTGQNRLDY
jgi:hypothetical protein